MEAKHTPGPWRRFGGMVDGYGIASNAGAVIEQGAFNGLHNEANARLIAAAPELLAVLDEVMHLAQAGADGNAQAACEDIMSACAGMIAKARGE